MEELRKSCQGEQEALQKKADMMRERLDGAAKEQEVYSLWRRNIYKTQSNIEVSQFFQLFRYDILEYARLYLDGTMQIW